MPLGRDRQAAVQRAAGKSATAPKAAAPSQSSAAAAAAGLVVVQEIPDKEGFLSAFELFRKAKAPKKVFQVGGWVDVCVDGRAVVVWLSWCLLREGEVST